MKTVLLRCGGCGSDQANALVKVADDYSNGGVFHGIVLRCTRCGSETHLQECRGIRVNNTLSEGDGTFCVY